MLKRIKELLNRRGRKRSAAAPADGAPTVEAPQPRVQVAPRAVHRPIPRSDLDPDAVKIVHRLTRFDHSAYLVGGCVRDLLLERRPKDFDIGTSATPQQIKRLFRNSRIIGRRFRLAHIYFQQGKIIEVATFRALNGVDDGNGDRAENDLLIREDNQFGTPEEDALRRDFTVNALFYDVSRETVLDHADGLGDLRRRLIRTIGDPEVRFREDPIRILRAIKFAARLDFEIEAKTLKALQRTRHEIPKAAAPRILEEINRFCRGGEARRSFELLRKHGVFEIILPEIARSYEERQEAWKLLGALMDEIDRRQAKGRDVPTGAIYAALLLPVLREKLGWSSDGEVRSMKGLDLRTLADPILRPLAVRLRVSRKDQESCRQILLTLFRMVPPRRARRNTRRSILRRECLPDVLWILDTLGRELGGEFPAAYEHWARAAESSSATLSAPKKSAGPADSQKPKPAAAGAKRKRRSRSRRRPDKAGKEARPAPSPRKEDGKDMPPPWDDDYFFAALPSVPKMKGEDKQGDRYGAAAVAPPSEPAGKDKEQEAADGGDRPKRKRRPRRRRRRSSGTAGKSGGESGGKSGGSEG